MRVFQAQVAMLKGGMEFRCMGCFIVKSCYPKRWLHPSCLKDWCFESNLVLLYLNKTQISSLCLWKYAPN